MAKKHKSGFIAASFHYLVKSFYNEKDPRNPIEEGFSAADFKRITNRITNGVRLNEKDKIVIENIKSGKDLPFGAWTECAPGVFFGGFDGAYYGQKYRNNQLGEISADSLNLRQFHYLVTRLGDGKILVGVTYNGQFGDYDGIKRCFSYLLRRGNYEVASKTIKSIATEIGSGDPVEIKLSYRRKSSRPERDTMFGRSGAFAIKSSEFGADFGDKVRQLASSVRGTTADRRKLLAEIVSEADMIELDDDEIVGCSAVVRQNGKTRTVYFLGENNYATKFPLDAEIDKDGIPDSNEVMNEMMRVMRQSVVPLLSE